jgi:DNA-binding NtrC family response regulator
VGAVLLDLKLPDTNGLQLLQEARRRCLTCPIIVMTAYGTAEAVESAIASGAHHVVAKPFDLDHMLRLVRQCCPTGEH